MKFKKLFYLIFYSLLILQCNEKKYPIPSLSGTFIKEKNFSIADLKKISDKKSYKIVENHIIEGHITANDKGENFYKEIFIQDDSGGICIQIAPNPNEFNHDKYTLGKKLRILTRGLYLEKRNGESQLGSIHPSNQFGSILHPGKHIFLEDDPKEITKAKETKIGEIKDELLGSLIRLTDLKFDLPSKDKTFFSKNTKGYFDSHVLKNCQKEEIKLTVNKNAKFAKATIPKCLVNLRGILTKYGGEYQLKIRSLEDIEEDKESCSKIDENYLQELCSGVIQIEYKVDRTNRTKRSLANKGKVNDESKIRDFIQKFKSAFFNLKVVTPEAIEEISNLEKELEIEAIEYENRINQIQEEDKKDLEILKEIPTDKLRDLIFSRYIKLEEKEKYLSIYNGTGKEVDLSKYEIERVTTHISDSQYLSGNLADEQTLVLKHPNARIYKGNVQIFDKNIMNFGSTDQILLKKKRTILDKIGDKNWPHARGNKNLRREKLTGPNSNYENSEWKEIKEASINNPATFADLGKST